MGNNELQKQIAYYCKNHFVLNFSYIKIDHYYIEMTTPHHLIIFDNLEDFMMNVHHKNINVPDRMYSLNGIILWMEKMDYSLYYRIQEKVPYKESMAVVLSSGKTPRIINDDEKEKLAGILKKLNEALESLKDSHDYCSEMEYLEYPSLVIKPLPNIKMNAYSQLDVNWHLLDNVTQKGVWYVYFMYLPKLDSYSGYPLELLIYSEDLGDIIGNKIVGYEKQSLVLSTFIGMVSSMAQIPEKMVIGDMKTYRYLKEFISYYQIDYVIRSDDFFEESYRYYNLIIEMTQTPIN